MNSSFSKRIIAFAVVFIMSIVAFGQFANTGIGYADSKSELENKLAQIEQKQKQLKNSISSVQNDKKKEAEYQKQLGDKMSLSKQRINVLEEQISALNKDIKANNKKISDMEKKIDENFSTFKKRLRAMYMAGDDAMISVLFGCSDFYDMIAMTESIKRIAKHDNDLIEDLIAQKDKLQKIKKSLDKDKKELESKKATVVAERQELADDYSKTTYAIQELAKLEDYYKKNYDSIIAEQKKVEREIQRIIEEALRSKSNAAYVGGEFTWPVPNFYSISSGYGWRTLKGKQNLHKGTDIAGPGINGQNIVAANDGEVRWSGWSDSYGYYII
ncbi:MAG: hypothetical protein GX967_03625, partial [Clostridiales bacterium]|nr:hypothetical protein [Clostridiales bacterium]